MPVELYKHQQKAIDKMHNGCVLVGDVGTGKTITSLAYFFTKECKGVLHDYDSMRDPKDLYVITTAKKRDSKDWEGDAALLGLGKDPRISAGGVKVTVDSWNNIDRYKDVKDAFFIFDEQRVVGAGSWAKSFVKIAKQNRWILLSATPGDTWLDYIPVFLANGFYKNRTAFKDEHVVYAAWSKFPKVERYTGVGKLVRHRNEILVHMPYQRHTTRHLKVVPVDHDRTLFERVVKDRWHVYENRPIRDVAELFSVMRKVVNSDASRQAKLQDLLTLHPKLIVFYNFDYELEALRQLFEQSDTQTYESQIKVLSTEEETSSLTENSSPTLGRQNPNAITSGSTQSRMEKSENPSVLVDAERNDPKKSPSVQLTHSGTTSPQSIQWSNTSLAESTNFESGCAKNSSYSGRRIESGPETVTRVESTSGSLREDDRQSSSWSPGSVGEILQSQNESGRRRKSSGSLGEGREARLEIVGTPRVLHVRAGGKETNEYQVYVGRPSKWGNPFVIGKDGTRDEVIQKFREYVQTSDLMYDLHELAGKNLVCYCSPEPCHADVLLDLANRKTFAVAEWNGHKHEEIPKTDSWVYLVQYTAGAEGWNCIETDAMVFHSLTYSYKQFHQGQGRIDRLNTPFNDLWYYIFVSDSMIDKAISKSLKVKKNFNERDLAV